jgi:hypothetical protein
MKTDIIHLYTENPVKACQLALRRTVNVPERKRIDAINALLEMHGVEAISGEWQNGYWCDVVAVYCNTGDTYAPTVIQVRGDSGFSSSRFIVSSMGDFVERNEKRLQIR